jgi:hypothetical protein
MTSPASGTAPHIEITTDGGFVGRGLGGVVIDARSITATDLSRSCKGELTATEHDALASAAAKFEPAHEKSTGHPDQIGYTLKVGDQSTSWHGETPPAGAAAVFNAAWQVRQRVLDGCP